jgi:hypothetical protein
VRLLKQRIDEIGRGRLIGPDIEKTTFTDLASMLRNDYAANARRSAKRVEISLNHLTAYFGRSRAIDITKDRITAYIARRQEAGAVAATINRELAALKRAFSLAEEAGKSRSGRASPCSMKIMPGRASSNPSSSQQC